MPKKPNIRQINAALSRDHADKLERIAKARRYTLHAFIVRVLTNLAEKTPEPTHMEPPPPDATADPCTETVAVEIPIEMAMRLYTTARQMRDYKGEPWEPRVLARHLLSHACEHPNGIDRQMQEQVDPNYADIVPFPGSIRQRAFRRFHMLAIRMPYSTRQAVQAAASEAKVSLTKLVLQVLHDYLPEYEATKTEGSSTSVWVA